MQVAQALQTSAFSQTLGCEFLSVGVGTAHVRLAMQKHLQNRAGHMHGGAIFSLIDTAMGMACSGFHGFDQKSATLECKINYMRAVSDGEIDSIATVLHGGRRTLVVEAKVSQGEKLVACAQGTFVRV